MPKIEIIPTQDIKKNMSYKGLRIVHCDSDKKDLENFQNKRYQFMQDTDYNIQRGILTRKGFVSEQNRYRLVALLNPNLKDFVNLVKYDPRNPPSGENYEALGMIEAHEQTQSDFKGAKKTNTDNFKEYLVEAIYNQRTPYLPAITGWQGMLTFERTVFVAFDEECPNAMYGFLYLPKSPIMQADGQTQTAALFALSTLKDTQALKAFENFYVTLEVELGVDVAQAGQSFADRNGRGTNKNKNLVIGLDISSALSQLREYAIKGTVFDGRIAKGRGGNITITSTDNIVDLSTTDQMLLNIVSGGTLKSEQFKHHHIPYFKAYARDFFELLENSFGDKWKKKPYKDDTFRRLYIHGWAFALKAIALAYYKSMINEIGPLSDAIQRNKIPGKNVEESFKINVEDAKNEWAKKSCVPLDNLKERLNKIDWMRHRKHWIAITGCSYKDDKKKTYKLKNGEIVVVPRAQNNPTFINRTCDKILSNNWEDLCSTENEPI